MRTNAASLALRYDSEVCRLSSVNCVVCGQSRWNCISLRWPKTWLQKQNHCSLQSHFNLQDSCSDPATASQELRRPCCIANVSDYSRGRANHARPTTTRQSNLLGNTPISQSQIRRVALRSKKHTPITIILTRPKGAEEAGEEAGEKNKLRTGVEPVTLGSAIPRSTTELSKRRLVMIEHSICTKI